MIAFAVAQWAHARGAKKVCIVGRSNRKKALASQLQIDYVTAEELGNKNFDVVVEAVGTNEALATAISLTQSGGNLVLMGNPAGDMALSQKTNWRILRKQLHIVGIWNSSYDGLNDSEWQDVRKAMDNKTIRCDLLITHKYGKEKLVEGLELINHNSEPYCKVMVLWDN